MQFGLRMIDIVGVPSFGPIIFGGLARARWFEKREYCQSESWSITCPFGIPTYVELVKGARMRQAGTTNHTLDNVGGDETLQRNGLDTCPTSSMLKQMLVSFSAMARK
jgi:hypothetical protein